MNEQKQGLLPSTLQVAGIPSELSKVDVDPAVGIKLAPLTHSTINGRQVDVAAAEIAEGKQVHAHFHHGGEAYIVTEGRGRMHIGKVDESVEPPAVAWQEPVDVFPGDVFDVPALHAHSLVNNGEGPLRIVFLGAVTDLTTDRHLVDNPPVIE